jgi:hypothetical protein
MPVVPTPTLAPPTTPVANLSSAVLTLADLPSGFQVLSAADLQQLHLTESDLARALSSVSTQAKPQNLRAFLDSNPQKFQVVVSLILYPMNILEKAGTDLQLSNPESALQAFGTGFSSTSGGAKLSILPGMGKFGDASSGFTTSMVSGGITLRMDMVIVSRGQALEMIISMYQNGATPPASLADLTKILDSRTAAALGLK